MTDTVSLKDHLLTVIDEHDKQHAAALRALKELTAAAFVASEKAIVKAEEAQFAYNSTHNDLARKMDAQYKEMVPRAEANLKWDGFEKDLVELRKDISGLREAKSELGGKFSGSQVVFSYIFAILGLLAAVAAIVFK